MLEVAYLIIVGGCCSRECVVCRGGGALGGCGGYGLSGGGTFGADRAVAKVNSSARQPVMTPATVCLFVSKCCWTARLHSLGL